MKALHFTSTVGPKPTRCDHCGGEVENIGLVAPRCVVCGEFSLSHVTFAAEPVEVEVAVEKHDDGSATIRFGEELR